MKKYLWVLPTLFVSYEFGNKLFEVLKDNQEFMDIISVIHPLAPFSSFLSYGIGIFDFVFALAILGFSLCQKTKKYHPYLFAWAALWPFVPSSLRYFGANMPFEIEEVLLMSASAIIGYILWSKFAK